MEQTDLNVLNEKIANTYAKKAKEDKLYLRFCDTQEVQQKMNKFFIYKGKYLGNITSLK